MFFDGNVKVLEALREKRSLLQQNISHSHIRPLLIVCGGVMKGVYGGGAVSALETSGYGEVFDVVVGLSTGAPTVAYFLAGQSELGTRIYSEECCTKNFINPMRITRMCNTQYLVSVFKSPDKKLNTSKLLSSRTKLYIGVTEPKTAEQHFFSPETEEDLFSLVEASISMPGACPDPVHYRGKKWVDGSVSDPLPIEFLIDKHKPTHVIVLANRARAYDDSTPFWEQLLCQTILRSRLSKPLRKAFCERRALMSKKCLWIQQSSPVPILVSWGDTSLSGFTQQPYLLREAARRSYESWLQILGGQQ